jgi:hypothetical protein
LEVRGEKRERAFQAKENGKSKGTKMNACILR